jgi:hypothetical protein
MDIVIPNYLYYVTNKDFKSKIELTNKKIICYTDEWVAIASILGCEKGYNNKKPYIVYNNNLNDMNKPAILYVISDTHTFRPIFSHGLIYKYETNTTIPFIKKINIPNLLIKLKNLGVQIEQN